MTTPTVPTLVRIPTLSPLPSLLILLLFVGCASTPAIDTSGPIDPREIMRRVEERGRDIRALTGSGKISVETPEFSGGGSIQVRLLKPDSLQLEINGPFGVTVARGLVTDRDFQFYDGMNNTVATGETNAKNLQRVLRFPITFADILAVLTGSMGFAAAPRDIDPVGRLDGGSYLLEWRGEAESLEYAVDIRTLAVLRFTRRNAEGEILEEFRFRDFRSHAGIDVPHILALTRPMENESLTIVYDRVTINDFPMVFDFSYPRSARRIVF
ncbi:MAG: DUF4292 domain-containing protein [Bacteroidota bacterium]|nr:DUF4292 domain-containing protein [Bacteroidota bacterium]